MMMPGCLLVGVDALEHDTIMSRAELHAFLHLQHPIMIEFGRGEPAAENVK
jgi:hypothetical protein